MKPVGESQLFSSSPSFAGHLRCRLAVIRVSPMATGLNLRSSHDSSRVRIWLVQASSLLQQAYREVTGR